MNAKFPGAMKQALDHTPWAHWANWLAPLTGVSIPPPPPTSAPAPLSKSFHLHWFLFRSLNHTRVFPWSLLEFSKLRASIVFFTTRETQFPWFTLHWYDPQIKCFVCHVILFSVDACLSCIRARAFITGLPVPIVAANECVRELCQLLETPPSTGEEQKVI